MTEGSTSSFRAKLDAVRAAQEEDREPAPAPVPSVGTAPASGRANRKLRLTAASEIKMRPVLWAWAGRLALSTLALLAGREGVGKTLLAYTVAAAMTKGTLEGVFFGTPKPVIVCATEDSWEHTIVPRLMAAGANLDLVYRVDAMTTAGTECAMSLPVDLAELEAVVADIGAALVILDPLLSRLASTLDTHKDAEVRQALEPLAKFADASRCTVLGLIHVNKSTGGDLLTSVMASRAFTAVARTVLFVVRDADDERRRLVGVAKNNLGRVDLPALMFTVQEVKVADSPEGAVMTGQLAWAGVSSRTITEAAEAAAETAVHRTATSEAAGWLHDYLISQDGTAASADIKREGWKEGHSEDALQRARVKLGLESKSAGFPKRTHWSLRTTASTATTASTGDTTANVVDAVDAVIAVNGTGGTRV